MMEIDEVIDDLQNGYYIIQDNNSFKFGIDAVLLSDFAKSVTGNVLDLCTGTGIIPLLLAKKSMATHIEAVEIQEDMAALAKRSVDYNDLNSKISINCIDLKDASGVYGKAVFDAVTVNPPYMVAGAGLVNDGDKKTIARHEIKCTLEDVIRVSADVLKQKGRLFMVHRAHRIADILCLMRKYKIEPKIMQLVAPCQGKSPNLVLICGVKLGGADLKIMPTLYVRDGDGNYTKEIDEIYGR